MQKSNFQIFIENLVLSFLSVIKIVILSKWRGNTIKITNIKKDCVIMGNGPSLNSSIEEHKKFLKDKDLFCVNFFPNTDLYKELKPRYYVNIAPSVWRKSAKEKNKINNQSLYKKIAQNTDWELKLYIPTEARKHQEWKQGVDKNEKIEIKYINITPIEGPQNFCNFLFKKNLGMPRPHNVLIPSIITAIGIGYKRIYLIGADHSWLHQITVDNENNVLFNQKHFYDENDSVAEKVSDYYKGSKKKPLHLLLMKFVYAFKGYFIINRYAESMGVEIINLTPDSFIDAFKKENLNTYKNAK